MGLIFYLLTLQRYRYWRTRRRKCHQCGAKMRRLNEKEDNAYLTSAQDTEERLGTVDYDVWLCDKCGNVELYPFVKDQEKFTKCPQCGAIAYGVEYERIKVAPTTRHGGIGERVKRCRHCGYTDSTISTYPRKTRTHWVLWQRALPWEHWEVAAAEAASAEAVSAVSEAAASAAEALRANGKRPILSKPFSPLSQSIGLVP